MTKVVSSFSEYPLDLAQMPLLVHPEEGQPLCGVEHPKCRVFQAARVVGGLEARTQNFESCARFFEAPETFSEGQPCWAEEVGRLDLAPSLLGLLVEREGRERFTLAVCFCRSEHSFDGVRDARLCD